jgi:hypothetical protein
MDKWGRNYKLLVGTIDGDTVQIEPPFTLQFDITRNTLTSANVCQLRIYNLSQPVRNKIRYNISEYTKYMPVKLYAGYGDNIPIIFQGNITQAWSVRERTNMVTQIECFDGGYAFVNATADRLPPFPAGTTQKSIVADLAETLPHVTKGSIGEMDGVLLRKNSFSGATLPILSELTGGRSFIDNEKFNVLASNEYIDTGSTLLINSDSGLLGTPVQELTIVRFDMIFEPMLAPGIRIKLQSETEQNLNGFYKVTAVKHRGIISSAVSGELTTTGEFFYSKILTGVKSS